MTKNTALQIYKSALPYSTLIHHTNSLRYDLIENFLINIRFIIQIMLNLYGKTASPNTQTTININGYNAPGENNRSVLFSKNRK